MTNYGISLCYLVGYDIWRGGVGNLFIENGMGNLERVAMEDSGDFLGAVSGTLFCRRVLFDSNYL